jgi:hypothetical protein
LAEAKLLLRIVTKLRERYVLHKKHGVQDKQRQAANYRGYAGAP